MDGQFVPDDVFVYNPWYLAPFEDIMTIQFNHRVAAYLILVVFAVHLARMIQRNFVDTSIKWLAAALLIQVGLGIWTLLAAVPIFLALAHQGLAIFVFGLSLYHLQVGLVRAK